MIEGHYIDAVFTDDETELVTIISGLEAQARQLESLVEKAKRTGGLMTFGSVVSLGLSFLENDNFGKFEYLAISAGLVVGGIERVVKERKMLRSIRSKDLLARRLKQELEPADLERYEERDEPVYEEDDGDDEYFPI